MMTPLGYREKEDALQEAGIDACLTKPIKQSQLYDCLITLLAARTEKTEKAESALNGREPLGLESVKVGLRLLIAEDNIVNQKVTLRQLQKFGVSADAVANGFEALEALELIPYDIVLMDCQMPEMDGYEATMEIRRREGEERHTTIIALTAHALEGDREKCLAAGMDDYLAKPVRQEDLERVLNRWLSSEDKPPKPEREIAPNSRDALLDQSALANLRKLQEDGEPDILAEFVAIFANDIPKRLENLQSALKSGDYASVQRIAHTLKGSCGNLGARKMSQIALELERLASSDAADLPLAELLLSQLRSAFISTCAAFDVECFQGKL
jgi:CheY-like chemotaxis protein